MESSLRQRVEQITSAPRLQRYREASTSDLDTVALYCWNIQLAEALMPAIAILEVALRNAIHNTLTDRTGTDFWFKPILKPRMYETVTERIHVLTQRHGYPPTSGKVISELTFGFWSLMLSRSYNALWWSPPDSLLPNVIPNHPSLARDTRKHFATRVAYFVTLRNRVMHQEAIFQGVAALNRPIMAIDVLHAQLIETIGWINEDAATLATCMDHFEETYHHGLPRVRAALIDRFHL